jgi:hypothetical protein
MKNSSYVLRVSRLVVLMGLLPLFARGASYYVATTGSDSTGNGSSQKPWKTLSYAAKRVTAPGNTIYVSAGNYVDNEACLLGCGVSVAGAGASTVTIASTVQNSGDGAYLRLVSPSASPVTDGNQTISGLTIDGSNKTLEWGVIVRGRDTVTLSDLRFRNTKIGAIFFISYDSWANSYYAEPPAYGENVVIANIETENTTTTLDCGPGPRQGAIQLKALAGAHVYNLRLNESYAGCGVGVKAVGGWLKAFNGHNWDVRTDVNNPDAFAVEMYNFLGDSEIHHCSLDHGISLNGGPSDLAAGSLWNLRIHDCTVTAGIEASHHHLDLYENFIRGLDGPCGGSVCVWHTNGRTDEWITRVRIHHNVLRNMRYTGVLISDWNAGNISGVEVYNNVIDGVSLVGWGGLGVLVECTRDGNYLDDISIRNNVIMNCEGRPISLYGSHVEGIRSPLITHNTLYGNRDSVSDRGATGATLSDNTSSDPGLALAGTLPFPYYAPANGNASVVDAGTLLGLPYRGTSPDIGAYEFNDGSSPWWEGETYAGASWWNLGWFGYYAHVSIDWNWAHHLQHGLVFIHSGSTPGGVALYIDMGSPWGQEWMWTGNGVYPWLYSYSQGTWLYYKLGSQSPRWFFNWDSQQWEAHP